MSLLGGPIVPSTDEPRHGHPATSTANAPPPLPHMSSPVKRVAEFFAAHKRNKVQAFGYNETIHQLNPFESSESFLKFLRLPDKVTSKRPKESLNFTYDNFINAANALTNTVRNDYFSESRRLLVWKATGARTHRGHVTDTNCKPDITVAYQNDFDKNSTVLWPFVHLAGERGSKGKSPDEQKKQAISYLHYLLLTRPDLRVAQGLLTSEKGLIFLFGIGGVGIRNYELRWDQKDLHKLMHGFVYRLYDPGEFADPSYSTPDPKPVDDFVKYTVRIQVTIKAVAETETADMIDVIECPSMLHIYASSPFESRTHVFSNPASTIMVNGKALTVLKDQLCRVGARFDEQTILDRIHNPERVPGVVEAVYHRLVDDPFLNDRDAQVRRVKNHLGLGQSGSPFVGIRTLQEVLKVAFDVLEVLRFLRVERNILHRDISKGNVMYMDPETPTSSLETSIGSEGKAENKLAQLKFSQYLLGETDEHSKTSVLLVDFDHAEDLSSKQGPEHKRVGTPVFIARAVEEGGSIPFPDSGAIIPAFPASPQRYSVEHPTRTEKFPVTTVTKDNFVVKSLMNGEWRHELDHDVESVFWLLLYWSMVTQPKQFPSEPIHASAWSKMIGNRGHRHALIITLAQGWEVFEEGLTHSVYRPHLVPLLRRLATMLTFDRSWLDKAATQDSPEYVAEAFQRLILQFLIDHPNQDFMLTEAMPDPRVLQVIPQNASVNNKEPEAKHREHEETRFTANLN